MKKMKLNIQLFAVTNVRIVLEQVSQNTAGNYSIVRVSGYAQTTGQSHNDYNNAGTYTIDGTTYTFYSTLPANTDKQLFSNEHQIYHNPDGTKTVSASFSFNTYISAGVISASNSLTLTQIYSTPDSCPTFSGYVGQNITIYANNVYNHSYTHSLRYVVNNQETTIYNFPASDNDVMEYVWTIPSSFADLIERVGTTYVLPLKYYTFYNGTQIGVTDNFAIITLRNEDVTPTINSVSLIDINQTTIDLSGSADKIIAFKSDIQATIDYSIGQYASLESLSVLYPITDNTSEIIALVDSGNTLLFNAPNGNVFFYQSRGRGLRPITFRVESSKHVFTTTQYDLINNPDVIPYSPIYWNASENTTILERDNALSTSIKLNVNFEWWKGIFPVDNTPNTLTISWRVKERKSGASWSNWQTISNSDLNTYELTTYTSEFPNRATTLSGTITINNDEQVVTYTPIEIDNPLSQDGKWDYLSIYDFEIKAEDLLDTEFYTKTILSSIPIYDAWQNSNRDRYFNVNGKILLNNSPFNRYAQVFTNETTNIQDGTTIDIPLSYNFMTNADFTLQNGKLYLPAGVSVIEISGSYSGYGSMFATITVYTMDNTSVGDSPVLTQPSGNGYFRASIPTKIVQLNPNIEHYVKLRVGAYNMTAILNGGFGDNATNIKVRVLE